MPYVPTVIEQSAKGERAFDLYSRLLKERIIFVNDEINDLTAGLIVGQLIFLAAEDKEKDISMYINSPGGVITSGLAIYDTMQYIDPKVSTICIGQAASFGAVLLAAGATGKRYALPNARIMLHQPLGGAHGQASDIEIQAKEVMRLKKALNEILVKHTGQDLKQIEKDTDRDFFMSPEEAKTYGLIDEVIKPTKLK